MKKRRALVVLSGGQDSATCAAWARQIFDEVHCLSFNYGQRHKRELVAAAAIADIIAAKSHTIVEMPVLTGNPACGLTTPSIDVNEVDPVSGLPKSFLPGRNLVFLTAAASFAISRGIHDIVTGVCQTDCSGYPDCRDSTIKAVELAVLLGNQGLVKTFSIHTPLMHLTKAETVKLASELPGGWDCVRHSWTCYLGGDAPCVQCPACQLRAKGFHEANMADPALDDAIGGCNGAHSVALEEKKI